VFSVTVVPFTCRSPSIQTSLAIPTPPDIINAPVVGVVDWVVFEIVIAFVDDAPRSVTVSKVSDSDVR
jgi:hypothetical protein